MFLFHVEELWLREIVLYAFDLFYFIPCSSLPDAYLCNILPFLLDWKWEDLYNARGNGGFGVHA